MTRRSDPSVCRLFLILFLTASSYCALLGPSPACAEDKTVFRGMVTDVGGRAVEGAMVFMYSSPDVKRSADFISPRTGKDGLFHIVLTPGRYWVVARVKKGEEFGPLLPGDRHSGDPREVEIAAGRESEATFVVADIKDIIREGRKGRTGPLRVSGRVLDKDGAPVRDVYVIANKKDRITGMPDYISAWVDSAGRYTLVLPRGRYYLGSAKEFPPGSDFVIDREATTLDAERSDLDIVRKPAENK